MESLTIRSASTVWPSNAAALTRRTRFVAKVVVESAFGKSRRGGDCRHRNVLIALPHIKRRGDLENTLLALAPTADRGHDIPLLHLLHGPLGEQPERDGAVDTVGYSEPQS